MAHKARNESIKNSLGLSHDLIQSIVKPGDTVIDATAGNGHDTVFLARLVGPEGKVYSFDVQQQALDKTAEKLAEQELSGRVQLVLDGHQNMDAYVNTPVRAVMFNLGYLPGGDHHIGTRGDTTIEAIEKAMTLVSVNGIVSVVIYYGGDSGFEEKDRVLDFVCRIDFQKFKVMKTDFVNQPNCPPILIGIEKLVSAIS